MGTAPSKTVRGAFGLVDVPIPLGGGEGRSFRVGEVVLKPCDDPVEWSWLGACLPTLEQDGFRLAMPLPALDGEWVVDGWCAQAAVPGAHEERWLDVLRICRRFHRAVASLTRPSFIDARTHPYAVGDRVAWAEIDSPVSYPLLDRLLRLRQPVDLASQVIHGDLTENVLFVDGLLPAGIDVTPYWRPPEYALAIVIGDAVRWRGASADELFAECSDVADLADLFVRAIIFRLVTSLLFDAREATSYESIVELAEAVAG
jgi:uncharacterized protein (TIGR02569 family)